MNFERFISQVSEMASATACEEPESEETVLTLSTPGGRRQVVRANPFEEDGRSYLRFYTPIGKTADLPKQILKTAMELNASLTHGAFALFEGQVVLADTMELQGANPEEGARILGYLGRMADSFEKMVSGVDRS